MTVIFCVQKEVATRDSCVYACNDFINGSQVTESVQLVTQVFPCLSDTVVRYLNSSKEGIYLLQTKVPSLMLSQADCLAADQATALLVDTEANSQVVY